jgi:hypothetical protein
MENEKLPIDTLAVNQNEIPNVPPGKAHSNEKVAHVKTFFKDELLKIVKSIFTQPIKGVLGVFTNTGAAAYIQALILIATTLLIYTIVPYLMVGSQARDYIGFGPFFKLGLSVALVLVIISALSFGVKAISGKPDFEKELLTGGLCGIPLMIFIIIIALYAAFEGKGFRYYSPESLIDQGVFLLMITLYLMLMLFNIVQQSFKASGTNDALSWYLSPFVIFLAFYIGAKIAMAIFEPSYGYHGSPPFGY